MIFTTIKHVELPEMATVGTGFTIVFEANGDVPFAQIIVRHDDGWPVQTLDDVRHRIRLARPGHAQQSRILRPATDELAQLVDGFRLVS